MFDIGFPELMLVSIVALLVIGPDKLPSTVRTLSLWIGRFRRSLTNLRMEIENEIGADEIRQQLHNESVMSSLKETRTEIDGIIDDTNQSIRQLTHPMESISATPTGQDDAVGPAGEVLEGSGGAEHDSDSAGAPNRNGTQGP